VTAGAGVVVDVSEADFQAKVIDTSMTVPVVIDFRVDPREMVFPMVPSGASNDAIILGPEGVTPTIDPAEAPIA